MHNREETTSDPHVPDCATWDEPHEHCANCGAPCELGKEVCLLCFLLDEVTEEKEEL